MGLNYLPLFIKTAQFIAGKLPELVLGTVAASFGAEATKYMNYRRSLKDSANRVFNEHVAPSILTRFMPSDQEKGAFNQKTDTLIHSTELSEVFKRSYSVIEPYLNKIVGLSEEGHNPNVFILLREHLDNATGIDADTIMEDVRDDWTEFFESKFSSQSQLLSHFDACDEDGYIRIFPVLTHNREDSECFRILLLTRDQLDPAYYADKDMIHYDSSRGFDKGVTPFKESRLDTLKTLSEQFNDPQHEWLEAQTYVNVGEAVAEASVESAVNLTDDHFQDEPCILSFQDAVRDRDNNLWDLAIIDYVSNNDGDDLHPSPLRA